MSENTPNQLSKFRTKNWVEINDKSHVKYNSNTQIKFKTSMLKPGFCGYSFAYDAAIAAYKNDKQAISKNCTPFTDSITERNNTEVDNPKDLDVVMSMYDLIEYSNNYSKTTWRLYQFCRDGPNDKITDSESFKFK